MFLSISVVRGRVRRFGYGVLAIASLAGSGVLDAQTSDLMIYGTPLTSVSAYWRYEFQPWAAPQGILTFAIVNQPAWAQFDSSTGQLSGIPASTDVGTYGPILISASDGGSVTYLSKFFITVLPYISAGSMVSSGPEYLATAGQAYAFQATTVDSDGYQLAFTFENKPPWLTFDRVNGLLFGTPLLQDVGGYPDFRIGATNGFSSVTVPFKVSVQPGGPAGGGSATLSWLPPTENTDGSVLTDLAGYRIYFGPAQDSLNRVVKIPDAGISAYVIDGLPPGTWYFAMVAYDASGIESDLSPVVSMDF